jgi:hypothetical protein
MGLLLLLFYRIVIPGTAVVAALWLWRRAKDRHAKIRALFLILPIVACLTWTLYGGEKYLLDAQVRELCAKDGGIKVYETVKLPANKFGQYGEFRIPDKQHAKPGDDYYEEWDIIHYDDGNPSTRRDHFLIYRRSDSRLLGEAVSYSRIGGDLPGPWHESSFTCPDKADDVTLNQRIFVRTN